MQFHSFLVAASSWHILCHSFTVSPVRRKPFSILNARKPSKVVDFDGPSPPLVHEPAEEIDIEDLDEYKEMMCEADMPHPVPHQPWRKGDLAGCDAPLSAEWRLEAEEAIKNAVKFVGGEVIDVTWFLTTLLITVDEKKMPGLDQKMFKNRGPLIDVREPRGPMYRDPKDPNPEPIWITDEEDKIAWTEEQEHRDLMEQLKSNTYAQGAEDENYEKDDSPLRQMTEHEVFLKQEEEDEERQARSPREVADGSIFLDKAGLSIISQAILDILEPREEELEILCRHEIVLTSPGRPDVLEYQKQFNKWRGKPVIVETQDPWESNRTLKGKLVDRNSMDLIINIQGRMVTVPHVFIKCVRIPSNVFQEMKEEEEENEEDEDDDDEEEEVEAELMP